MFQPSGFSPWVSGRCADSREAYRIPPRKTDETRVHGVKGRNSGVNAGSLVMGSCYLVMRNCLRVVGNC